MIGVRSESVIPYLDCSNSFKDGSFVISMLAKKCKTIKTQPFNKACNCFAFFADS